MLEADYRRSDQRSTGSQGRRAPLEAAGLDIADHTLNAVTWLIRRAARDRYQNFLPS